MKTSLVKIGKFYYAIVPNELWKKSGLPVSGKVELTSRKGKIYISAIAKVP